MSNRIDKKAAEKSASVSNRLSSKRQNERKLEGKQHRHSLIPLLRESMNIVTRMAIVVIRVMIVASFCCFIIGIVFSWVNLPIETIVPIVTAFGALMHFFTLKGKTSE